MCKMSSLRVTLVLGFMATLWCLLRANEVLSSQERIDEAVRLIKRNSRRTDIKPHELKCILSAADELEPMSKELPDGRVITGYNMTELEVKVTLNIGKCIEGMKVPDDDDDDESTDRTIERPRTSVVRRPIKPEGPLGRVANWLGLEQTVHSPYYCGECYSGCHYCCIQNGAGGFGFCFGLYCGGNGDCD